MRLWMFDRSGPYTSEKFDIHKEPERFVTVVAGYALMTDAELGLNTFVRRDKQDWQIYYRREYQDFYRGQSYGLD